MLDNFVSDQEILQFFGVFGTNGIVGMLISICLFFSYNILAALAVLAPAALRTSDLKTIIKGIIQGAIVQLFGEKNRRNP